MTLSQAFYWFGWAADSNFVVKFRILVEPEEDAATCCPAAVAIIRCGSDVVICERNVVYGKTEYQTRRTDEFKFILKSFQIFNPKSQIKFESKIEISNQKFKYYQPTCLYWNELSIMQCIVRVPTKFLVDPNIFFTAA